MKILRIAVCFAFLLTHAPVFAHPLFQSPSSEEIRIMQAKTKAELELILAARGASAVPLKGSNISPLTSLQATVNGTFWRNPKWVKMLELSADQQIKMDEIFQQYRLKLVDLTASLQKEELILEPLLGSTRPAPESESKILAQIDRIADARAELEKANSRMLVGILQVLTNEQWTRLPIPAKKGSIPPKPVKAK